MAKRTGMSKDTLATISATRNLIPEIREDLAAQAVAGTTTRAVVKAVASFAPSQQREAFTLMNSIGARAAKRWIQCQRNPPTCERMADRIVQGAAREFPAVPLGDLAQALLLASDGVEELIESDEQIAATLIEITARQKRRA